VRAAALALSVLTGCDAPTIAVAVDASTDAADASAIDPAFVVGAQRFCQMQQKCFPHDFAVAFGDLPTCLSRHALLTSHASSGYGALVTSEQRRRCYEALFVEDCTRARRMVSEGDLPPECRVPGSLKIDEPCNSRWQCQSEHCSGSCGVCVTPLADGSACTTHAQCRNGSICWDSICIKLRERGEACDSANICHLDLNCASGRCVDPPKVGDPCVKEARFPCGPMGLRCDRASNTCQALTVAKAGEPCGVVDDYPVDCAFGLTCRSERPGQNGVCVASVADNGRCGTFWWVPGGGCLWGSHCGNEVCRPFEPTDCSRPGIVP
jgi:hypothetical protein